MFCVAAVRKEWTSGQFLAPFRVLVESTMIPSGGGEVVDEGLESDGGGGDSGGGSEDCV